jgi:uncharacterized protein (UPF0332 family)
LTPEAERFLDKARECLADAQLYQARSPRIAGREAYLSAFHAAEALIRERTGKVAKTHRGVRGEFARLTRGDVRVDRSLSEFLAQAYELKSIADYGTGRDGVVSVEAAAAAVEAAARFIDCVANLISAG